MRFSVPKHMTLSQSGNVIDDSAEFVATTIFTTPLFSSNAAICSSCGIFECIGMTKYCLLEFLLLSWSNKFTMLYIALIPSTKIKTERPGTPTTLDK